jgi:hypothetical protein
MLAFGLSIVIFFICLLFGKAILPRKIIAGDLYLKNLISPVVGLAALITLINACSRLGVPVKSMGLPLACLFLIACLRVLKVREPKKVLFFNIKIFLAIPAGLLVGAWPILKYGFHWFSYVNDDMNNYVLAATRFYENGFYSKPIISLFNGTDYSGAYYYFHVLQGVRPGSELFLAFVTLFKPGSTLQIFMPTILALQMILISATLGLIRVTIGKRRTPLVAAFCLLILTPLVTLGFLYQLIGQVGGLSIAIGIVVVAILISRGETKDTSLRLGALLGLLLSAQLIWYPEIIPFLALPGFMGFIVAKKRNLRSVAPAIGVAFLLSITLLNAYFVKALKFTVSQLSSTTSVNSLNKLELFPYFLRPHGLAALFGLTTLNRLHSEPWESITIVVALVIFVAIFTISLINLRNFELFNGVTLLMLCGFAYLVVTDNGFGSFKLAMYMQPFLICSVLYLLLNWKFDFWSWLKARKMIFSLACFSTIVLFINLVGTTQYYVIASTGTKNYGFSEIPFGSQSNLPDQIRNAERTYKKSDGVIISTAFNLSQIKMEAIASRGLPIVFPVNDVFQSLGFDQLKIQDSVVKRVETEFREGKASNYFQRIESSFDVKKRHTYLVSNNIFESLNKSSKSDLSPKWDYRLQPNPTNYLMFINSKNGPVYYDSNSIQSKDVIFQPEPNPMIPGGYTQSMGNKLLLQAINPQSDSMLQIDLSATVLSQYNRRIPNITLVGNSENAFSPVGLGSARLLLPLPQFQTIENGLYFEVNFDQSLKRTPTTQTGLTDIYGKKVKTDPRLIAALVSNISLVSPSVKYGSNVPTVVSKFPKDISNPGLFYSGAYEDGWLSQDSYFYLKASGSSVISFKGLVPQLKNEKFSTNVVISVDDKQVGIFHLKTGAFDLKPKIFENLAKGSVHKVGFHFSNIQVLPNSDGRPASVFVNKIGI